MKSSLLLPFYNAPDIPAFCHIMELIATSKSKRVSLNHCKPSTQLILRYATRKQATTCLMKLFVQPILQICLIAASTRGNPVLPFCQAFRCSLFELHHCLE